MKRTQQEAARAAAPVTPAPKKQPAPKEAEPDYDKWGDEDISTLLKEAVKNSGNWE